MKVENIMGGCLLLCLCACNSPLQKQAKTKDTATPVVVSVAQAQTGNCYTQNYAGQLCAGRQSTLSFLTGGTIQAIYVKQGQRVSQGQVLAKVDNSQAKHLLASAEAALQQAEDGYQRLKQLFDNGSLPEVKWIEIQTKLKEAQASASAARKNLGECSLKAPFSGIVSSRLLETGANALPSQPVLTLINTDSILLEASIPESDLPLIAIGQKAFVSFPALPDSVFEAYVSSKGVESDRLAHTYTIQVSINNRQGLLTPGMTGKLTLQHQLANEGIEIPFASVQLCPEGRYVWIVSGGKTHRHPVTLGRFTDKGVLITSGIALGDSVVVEGRQKVYENGKVSIKEIR